MAEVRVREPPAAARQNWSYRTEAADSVPARLPAPAVAGPAFDEGGDPVVQEGRTLIAAILAEALPADDERRTFNVVYAARPDPAGLRS